MYIHAHTYTQLSNTCRYIYAPDEVNLLLADLQSLCNYCRCSGRGRRTVWYSATTKFRLHSVCVAYVIYWLTVWESTLYVWRVMYWLDVWGKDRMHLFPISLLWRGGRGLAEMTFTRWSTCTCLKTGCTSSNPMQGTAVLPGPSSQTRECRKKHSLAWDLLVHDPLL